MPHSAKRERVFTLPNLLTLSRIPLAALVWFVPRRPEVLIPVMVIAAATDLLDGRFARMIRARREKRGDDTRGIAGERSIGAWLDPLCDKVFVVSLLAAIYVSHEPPLWIAGMIGAREILLVPMVLVYRLTPSLRAKKIDLRAGLVGKLATVSQFGAVGAILMAPGQVLVLAVVACVSGLLAVAYYSYRLVAPVSPTPA